MSLPNDLAEAYTIAPTDVVIVETIELQHPSFVDDNGDPTSIYVAVNQPDSTFEGVDYVGLAVEWTEPEVRPDGDVTASITLDNVGREIVPSLERAIEDGSRIQMIVRTYLSTIPNTAQRTLTMTLENVQIPNQYKITGTLIFRGLNNKTFPAASNIYTLDKYPGLAL